MSAPLSCENLSLSYGKRPVLHEISIGFGAGEFTSIVGPNACGKSSLLRCLTRLQEPSAGEVHLDGEPIRKLATREVARRLAFLPQSPVAPDGMRVFDLVLRGRTPHQSPLQQWSKTDQEIVEQALEHVGLENQAERPLSQLSGGQVQRAWIAMVLAQDTGIVILDEPTTFLDLPNQHEVLELLRKLQSEKALSVVAVLHDINLAARYSDRIVALKEGRLHNEGTVSELVTAETITQIYGRECSVISDPHHGVPHVIVR